MIEKDAFLSRVEKTEKCWLWRGVVTEYGYGIVKIGDKYERAHRVSYQLFNGEIQKGLMVCHHCDVRNCVKPDHLYAGTAKENSQDRERRGRGNRCSRIGEDGPGAKLSDEDVLRLNYMIGKISQIEIAARFEVDPSLVSKIKTGRIWTHITKRVSYQRQ